MFSCINSLVVNVDPQRLDGTHKHTRHTPRFLCDADLIGVLLKLNPCNGDAGVASDERRIISGIKVFAFLLHLALC